MSGPRLAIELAIMATAAVILAALGPFGTWAAPFGGRLISWAIFAFGGYACFRPVIAGGSALALQTALPVWAAIASACALASMPTTLIVAMTIAGDQWRTLTADYLGALYLQVLIVGATITVVQLLVRKDPGPLPRQVIVEQLGRASAERLLPGEAALPAPNLLALLPPHLGTKILCVENEDHYVRVHTSEGSSLVLMRLRDAIVQLAGIDGEQVHRSWWVARSAVTEVIRAERRVLLKLSDAREVPVARSALGLLRDKGWL